MADTDDSLLREVNEELRREKFAKFLDQYGLAVGALAVLLVAGILGGQWWQRSALQEAQSFGAKYRVGLQQVQDGKTDDAARSFTEIVNNGPKGYAVLARLKLAGAKLKAGKNAEAVALYDAVINDGGADELLAGFARLQAASLRAGDADWTEMQNRLNDLIEDASPWRHSARELLGLEAQRTGNLPEARKYFEQVLADRSAPRSISARVRIMMSLLAEAELAGAAQKPTGADGGDKKPMGGATKSN